MVGFLKTEDKKPSEDILCCDSNRCCEAAKTILASCFNSSTKAGLQPELRPSAVLANEDTAVCRADCDGVSSAGAVLDKSAPQRHNLKLIAAKFDSQTKGNEDPMGSPPERFEEILCSSADDTVTQSVTDRDRIFFH